MTSSLIAGRSLVIVPRRGFFYADWIVLVRIILPWEVIVPLAGIFCADGTV
ncbi:MAG: hypothetical protein R3E79_02755 [Caldilineaceae bacterium]